MPLSEGAQGAQGAEGVLTPQGDKVEKGTKSRYEDRYEGYEGNWSTEYRTHEYPEDSKGLHHHPEYSSQSMQKEEKKAPEKSGSPGLMVGCLLSMCTCAASIMWL